MPSPLVSTSGTVPPALYNVKVVPGGKVPVVPTTMLKVSVPVPVFVTVLVKLTVEPGAAGPGLVSLESVTAAVCVTVNGTVLEEPVTVEPVLRLLLYDVVAVLFNTPGAGIFVTSLTFTWKVIVPDWPGVT